VAARILLCVGAVICVERGTNAALLAAQIGYLLSTNCQLSAQQSGCCSAVHSRKHLRDGQFVRLGLLLELLLVFDSSCAKAHLAFAAAAYQGTRSTVEEQYLVTTTSTAVRLLDCCYSLAQRALQLVVSHMPLLWAKPYLCVFAISALVMPTMTVR